MSTSKDSLPEPPSSGAPFSIVGIGASAGGLGAVSELLENLPADTGMAFIFVQHLAPGHASMLTEILSRKFRMPVIEAVQGQTVQPNHFYVITPNTTLTLVRGCLELRPRDDASGLPMPIDDLFHSLAEDQGSGAIGITLSGSGTDGALGMQAIKGENGITFAQDEMSAQCGSMPRAAVGLGCVDFVMSPPDIALELMRISRHPLRGNPPASGPGRLECDEESFKRIFHLLHAACNLDFTHYKRGTIKRRLARRLALQNMGGIPEYLDFLDTHPDEVKSLCQDFLIRVTGFFRDPETFENLVKYVFPCVMGARSSEGRLRIWVPGCSTGEEVYSIAICCLEYLASRGAGMQIQIFGTDVSEDALQMARAGTYVENIARSVSPERLEKFFVRDGAHYKVSKSVRDLCIFSRHDVTRDPPFSRLDMISCRNLLIYMDPLLQKQVISLFHYALNPEGVLVLAPAENLSRFTDTFTLSDNGKIRFYVKMVLSREAKVNRRDDDDAGRSVPSFPAAAPFSSGSLKKKYTDVEQQKMAVDRISFGCYVPAAALCDENLDVLEFRGDTAPYLTQPSGPRATNLQKLARPGLLVDISETVKRAAKDGAPVRKSGVRGAIPGDDREIALHVVPVRRMEGETPRFLVFFEDQARLALALAPAQGFWTVLGRHVLQGLKHGMRDRRRPGNDDESRRSKLELEDTRNHIHTLMEEYEVSREEAQASQEALLSSNEEFQSTNEELETAKEELQSANEELITTNEEIRHRNLELNTLNDRLQQALYYAETIINTVRQPFLVLDKDLRILRANPAFYATFKTEAGATEGQLLYDLGDRQWDIPALRQFLQSLLLKDTLFKGYEITHVFPKVGKKTMRLNGVHLVWEKEIQVLLAIEDVSDYRMALDALRSNNRHKDEFLAMLAHELRNPLAPIRNALEIWRRGDAGEKESREAQVIMGRQLQKMVQLVDDLLDVARITRGMIMLKKNPVDLAQVILQAVDGARHKFEECGNEIAASLPQTRVLVEGDAIRLEQVVSNLLINAAKYTPAGGRTTVTLEHEAGIALVRVADNGVGISPELLPYIFDLFVQVERSLDRKQGGLGLGLTLVRRLVELQGGSVEADSQGLGKGSEFIVRLPMMPETGIALPAPPPAAPKDVPFVKRRILIIEDNADAAFTTQVLLELQGHEVHVALGGSSGIEAAQTFRPEVILLNIGLPVMDGYEVARRLRALPATKKALIIALSGYGQEEDFRKSKAAGFDHHLVKPAATETLRALIAGEALSAGT